MSSLPYDWLEPFSPKTNSPSNRPEQAQLDLIRSDDVVLVLSDGVFPHVLVFMGYGCADGDVVSKVVCFWECACVVLFNTDDV